MIVIICFCGKMDFKCALSAVVNDLKLSYALKKEQVDAISAVCAGENVLAMLPTGFGKSEIFILPALILNKVRNNAKIYYK